MKIKPKIGVDKLIFGMKTSNVELLYGKPNKHFKDDDNNIIYLYNEQKMRLTFYADEDYKLGYIISSNANATLFDKKIIGKNTHDAKIELEKENLKNWEIESFDSLDNHFNEPNWIILQTEFEVIVKIELGAIIDEITDEFEWKFKME